MIEHYNIQLFGEVQGVFLRRTIKREANHRQFSGFIENKDDGTVYLEVEGPEDKLNQFIAWIRAGAGEGPHKIKRVEAEKGQFKAMSGEFEIR